MKLLLIHQIFFTNDQGGGTRHFEFARYLVKSGLDCAVVASDTTYLDGKRVQRQDGAEVVEGVRIERARTIRSLHRNFVLRVVAFLSFAVTSALKGLSVRDVDIVMGTSPPLPQAVSAWFVAALKRKPFLLEIRDLWPDFAIDMGVLKNPALIWMARRLEIFLYARASHIVVNSPAYRDYLLDQRGIAPDKVTVIPNGVDPSMFDPTENGDRIRQEFGLDDKFIVTYAGALGPANDIPSIVRAAEHLSDRTDVHFLIVGDGKSRKSAADLAKELKLQNITFSAVRPKSDMRELLGATDACLATLIPIPMFKMVYPNKVFDYLASGRPLILAMDGVIRDVVQRAEAAITVEPGNARQIADAVLRLRDDPEVCRQMGRSGRDYVSRNFNRIDQARDFVKVVKKTAGSPGGS